ncbi:MAG TPA: hypothetical protein VGE63_00550 [Candidatus Paceibacterota bacterium]
MDKTFFHASQNLAAQTNSTPDSMNARTNIKDVGKAAGFDNCMTFGAGSF